MKIKTFILHLLYLAVIAVYAYFIGCPVKRFTGFDCPFCGMTRAYTAFFCGDISGALKYHELFFLGIPLMLGLAHMRIFKRRRKIFIVAVTFCVACAVAFFTRHIIKAVL